MRHVGVDGCRFGWIAVTRAGGRLDYAMFRTIRDLISVYQSAERVFVDVPIGLPWKGMPIRPCDRLARSILGRQRSSSVFPVPCREAAHAATLRDAEKLNTDILGRSLTRQTWGICSKIADVDSFLAEHPGAARRLQEVHPEVCFWALSSGTAMRHKKSTAAGRNERLAVLAQHESSCSAFLCRLLSETRRRDVQADDVLDALAVLLTAEFPGASLESLAAEPYRDQRGLAMEMVYAATANLSPNLAVHRTGARGARSGR